MLSKRAFSLTDLIPWADKSKVDILSPLPPSDIPDRHPPPSFGSATPTTPSAFLSEASSQNPVTSSYPLSAADSQSSIPSTSLNNLSPPSPNLPFIPSGAPSGPNSIVVDGVHSNLVDLAHIPIQIGDLKAMGLNGWLPTRTYQSIIEYIHVFTGLPWWATIVVATILVRLAVAPLMLGGFRKMGIMALIAPQTEALTNAMKKARAAGDSHLMQRLTGQLSEHFAKHKVNPISMFTTPILTAAIFMTMFFSVRAMVSLPVPQLTVGGIPGWCLDLTVPDPTWLLPIIAACGTATTLHLGVSGVSPKFQTGNAQAMAAIMKTLSVCMLPVFTGFTVWSGLPLIGGASVAGFPAALLVYWATSNTFQVCQSLLLRTQWARTRFNLPPPPTAETLGRPIISDWEAIKRGYRSFADDAVERARKQQDAARAKQVAAGGTPILDAKALLEQKQARLAYEQTIRAEEDVKRAALVEASKKFTQVGGGGKLVGKHVVPPTTLGGGTDVQGWATKETNKKAPASVKKAVAPADVRSFAEKQLEALKARRKKAEEMLAAARLGAGKGAKK